MFFVVWVLCIHFGFCASYVYSVGSAFFCDFYDACVKPLGVRYAILRYWQLRRRRSTAGGVGGGSGVGSDTVGVRRSWASEQAVGVGSVGGCRRFHNVPMQDAVLGEYQL